MTMTSTALSIIISESASELRKMVKKESDARKKDRLRALYLIKIGEVTYQKDLARLLCYSNPTIRAWLNSYQEGGIEGLLTIGKSTGAPSKLPDEIRDSLKEHLAKDSFQSYVQVQRFLLDEFELELPYHTVYDIVRYQMKMKLR